jgi:hypothetical protein
MKCWAAFGLGRYPGHVSEDATVTVSLQWDQGVGTWHYGISGHAGVGVEVGHQHR